MPATKPCLTAPPSPVQAPVRQRAKALMSVIIFSLAIVFIAAMVQVGAGSYEMTWRQAWAALTDTGVWGQPSVLSYFFLGRGTSQPLGIGEPDALSTMTLIVWNVRLPR